MGYNYWVDACEFGIDSDHFKQIWQDAADSDSYDANTSEFNKFNHPNNLRAFIEHMFSENGFDCRFDGSGNLAEIDQNGDKLGDQDDFFASIGAYVTPHSYILCRGEDGCIWRWRFDGAYRQEDADIVFRTGSNDCPIRETLGKKNACTECPFGLICLCDANPRLRSARCGECGGDMIVDNVNDKVIAGITCSCQSRTFLIREYQKEAPKC